MMLAFWLCNDNALSLSSPFVLMNSAMIIVQANTPVIVPININNMSSPFYHMLISVNSI